FVVVDPAPLDRRRIAGTGASGLHVEMLGHFVVRIDGREVTDALAGRSRTVFQYLVLTAGPVPRDALIHVCWPELDIDRGRHHLDAALSSYSDRLEEELGVRPSDRLLALASSRRAS